MSATHRCLAPDHIGFGLSDKPADWDYLPEHQAENFAAWMDSLDLQNITLVVNDWGGPICLSYAIKNPERIKHLVILNTWMWSVADNKHFRTFSNMMGSAVGQFMIKNFNFFGKQVVKMAMGKNKAFTPAIHKAYYAHMATPAQRKGSWVFPKQIIGSSAWLGSLWQQHARINHIPTDFIWGMEDIAFRKQELDYWTSHWQNYTVTQLTDAGHYVQEVRPDVIIEALKQAAQVKSQLF
jgi:haloalkane dehalogenase